MRYKMKMTYAKAGVDQHKEEQAIKSIIMAIKLQRKIDNNQYLGIVVFQKE